MANTGSNNNSPDHDTKKPLSGYLNIVDENDQVIGQETRTIIHQQGFLHREVHVYFITPKKEIIFQHRAPGKDTYPDLLDATVGGHVEIGDNYLVTAVKEINEETGLVVAAEDLLLFKKNRKQPSLDQLTGKINNFFSTTFIYYFSGQVSDLQIEAGKAVGFVAWPFEKLKNISPIDKQKFVPYIVDFVLDNLVDL